MYVRYNISNVEEQAIINKELFIKALLELKSRPSEETPPPEILEFVNAPKNRYDDFVYMHFIAMLNMLPGNNQTMPAHRGPGFLPWHRIYLLIFERTLQSLPGYENVTIPYWDWTVNNTKTDQIIWNDDFMGGNGRDVDGRVTSGPFSADNGWNLYIPLENPHFTSFLKRNFAINSHLPTVDQLTSALKEVPYDCPPWNDAEFCKPSFRNRLEGFYGPGKIHNEVHNWVGGPDGTMSQPTSPNDPCFWLHHSNIDRVWAEWQQIAVNRKALHGGYLPINDGPAGQNLYDKMLPWDELRPLDVIDISIAPLTYRYDKYFMNTSRDGEESRKFFPKPDIVEKFRNENRIEKIDSLEKIRIEEKYLMPNSDSYSRSKLIKDLSFSFY